MQAILQKGSGAYRKEFNNQISYFKNTFSMPPNRARLFFAALVMIIFLASCGGSRKAQKNLLYLQGKLDTLPNKSLVPKEMIIQKGDLLSIIVYSDNPEATAIYNQTVQSGSGSGTTAGAGGVTSGYLVDQQGNIFMQSLGKIHVDGLTKQQLTEQLNDTLAFYLKNPFTDIRFLNLKVTVIGEVNKPGSYSIPQERLSILELVGLAGDLTVYGRRDNILVIREQDGKREFGRLDIRDPNVFQSPYFNLKQNDVILIEASPKKPTVNDQATLRNLAIVTGLASLISTAAIIYNAVRR